jgi:type II secretory pathway component PulC
MAIKRVWTCVVAIGLGAFIVILAGNFSGFGWYEELLRWLQPAPHFDAPPRPLARSGPIGPPVTVTPMQPEGNDSSVSEVPLPLVLVRTQRGRNSREGFAQIGVRAHSPQTYTAGALLANGARLTEIYEHYVVLERDGHTARLYLQGETQRDAGGAQTLTTVGGAPEPPSVIANSRDELTDYLRPSPVFVGRELHGYALYAGRKGASFSELGLQPGDVLTHINGTPVSNSADSLTTLHTLIDGEVVTVEVQRQGVPQTLSLDGSILRRADSTPSQITASAQTTAPKTTSSVTLRSLLTQETRP